MLIQIGQTKNKGRGIFATQDIPPGALLELAPVIAIPEAQVTALATTDLDNYYFAWGPAGNDAAIGLGFTSLYNHSYNPNARYEKNLAENLMAIYTIKPIRAQEEITVNYNGDPADQDPLWFEVAAE